MDSGELVRIGSDIWREGIQVVPGSGSTQKWFGNGDPARQHGPQAQFGHFNSDTHTE